MPKRKHEHDYDYIKRKLRRLERKLRDKRDGSESTTTRQDAGVAAQSPVEEQDVDVIQALLLSDEEPEGSPSEQHLREGNAQPSGDEVLAEAEDNGSKAAVTVPVPPPSSDPTTGLQPPDLATHNSEVVLDDELLELLGTDPTTIKKYGKDIQKDLARRLEHCATTGLSKELRKEFKETYLTPDNCKLIDPPALNPELKAAVSEVVTKRDKAIEAKQKQLSTAISCVSEAVTLLMPIKEKNNIILKLLINGLRIMCDCQYADTTTRRNFMLNSVKKDMKDQLQDTKIDSLLFSEGLADALKSAKAINKSVADLKIPTPKAPPKKAVPGTTNLPKNLNWRNPGPARRQPGPQRMPVQVSMRSRPPTSWKPSQQRPLQGRR